MDALFSQRFTINRGHVGSLTRYGKVVFIEALGALVSFRVNLYATSWKEKLTAVVAQKLYDLCVG